MGVEFNLVSRDAQTALTDFAEDFAMALAQGGVEQWAKENGVYRPSKALLTKWPVPVTAAGYAEFKGDVKYRDLFQKSFELTPKTWQDGVSALASVVEAPDFVGWTTEPAAMANAALSLPNEIIAGLLEANPACWDGENFFANAHPSNIFKTSVGTFDNDIGGAGTSSTIANLAIAKKNFRKIKGPNGKPMGLRMTHVLVPPALEETWRDILERDLIVESNAAVDNRHKGTVKLIVGDELTDDVKWYPLALNKPGMRPWVLQDEGAPEEIRQDKSSALYAQSLKIGIAHILRGNGGLALPHCVQRWAGLA